MESLSTYNSYSFKDTKLIQNNAEEGGAIYIRKCPNKPILNNILIYSNSSPAIYISESDIQISNSKFIDNYNAVVNDNNTYIPYLTNNYWGDSSGPYNPNQNPNGKGDSTNQYIMVSPWLTDPSSIIPARNVIINKIGINNIEMSWDSSSYSGVIGYKVCYKINENDLFYPDTIDVGNTTSYNLTELTNGETYYLSVICYDNAGNESWYSKAIEAYISPLPNIAVSDSTIDLGVVSIGDTLEYVILIKNTGNAELHITDISSNDERFFIGSNNMKISPGDSTELNISFFSNKIENIGSEIHISSNAANRPIITLHITGKTDISVRPSIKTIMDVPNDQGGFVEITFDRSRYDGIDSTLQLNEYQILNLDEENIWQEVGSVNATGDTSYSYIASTIRRMALPNPDWTEFKINAIFQDTNIVYSSNIMRGFSIDNIAPQPPCGLQAETSDNWVTLIWDKDTESDIFTYIVYRSLNSDISADSSSNILTMTTDTFYVDQTILLNTTYYYALSAIDSSANRGDISPEIDVINVGNSEFPSDFSLSQNYPNPFNPYTIISYALPIQSEVNMTIFNILGKKIQFWNITEQNAGWYKLIWDGRDMYGNSVPTGVYIYQIKAGNFIDSKKMIFMK